MMANTRPQPADYQPPTPRQIRFSHVADLCLALGYLSAFGLIGFALKFQATMPAAQYELMIAEGAIFGLIMMSLGMVYFALGVGHRLRTAIGYVAVALFFLAIVSSPPVSGFLGRLIFGGLAAVLGG